MKRTKTVIDLKVSLAVRERLRDIVKPLGEGKCEYVDEHNDHSVATEFGITAYNVAHVRKTFFGMLVVKPPRPAVPEGSVESRLAVAEATIAAMTQWLDKFDPEWAQRAAGQGALL